MARRPRGVLAKGRLRQGWWGHCKKGRSPDCVLEGGGRAHAMGVAAAQPFSPLPDDKGSGPHAGAPDDQACAAAGARVPPAASGYDVVACAAAALCRHPCRCMLGKQGGGSAHLQG